MVTPEKLYAATDCGLDIIAMHYPQARECAKTNQPFRMRASERTPSARLKLYNTSQGQVWKVTDFGGEGRAVTPIQIHMEPRNISFKEAMLDLAAQFNIPDEITRSLNRPDIRKQPATDDQPDGYVGWETDQDFTEKECSIMGPRVTPDHLKKMHWYRVKMIVSVKNREALYKYSNENYPIFMRECWFTDGKGKKDCFYKIYEPLNAEKRYRFQYQPKDKKPKDYINGLYELSAAYTAFNQEEERIFHNDPENQDKNYVEQKLPEAVICSGERDAICVRSLGYNPIWFNSETYKVTEEDWRNITRYVDRVYNIPDIDDTGRKKGTELALRFIDIYTVWLPKKLLSYRDHRGNPRKDFRDWMEIWEKNSDFRNLLEIASPAKFWTCRWVPSKGGGGQYKYSIDISCLLTFLKLNGFYTMESAGNDGTAEFIQIKGSVVQYVNPRRIRAFVHQWCIDTSQPRELRNLVLSTPLLTSAYIEPLESVELDFKNYTEDSQTFFFPRNFVVVTGKEIQKYDIKDVSKGRYVWDTDIIQHDIRIIPDMFTISSGAGKYESEDFDIEIMPHASKFFAYLINSSRLFWRKELEEGVKDMDEAERSQYLKEHKFDIAGPLLDAAEIQEQKQCLISKIFTIGYMLHRYKSLSRPWAPFLMDNIIGENDQCNGRSGKSFMVRGLNTMVRFEAISGRNKDVLKNQFAFERINKHVGIVVVDDCDEYLPFKDFYDSISADMVINPKKKSSFLLNFDDAPKFAFTTNYVPREFNASTVGRMLFVVFSDYYHQRTEENDYMETRGINDDFGKNLMSSSYTESEWEADINFLLQCLKFYLSVSKLPVKIEPKMENIIFRKYLRDMSDNFREWAEQYFAQDGDNLDCEVVRETAFNDYKRFSGVQKITMQRFSKSLRGFCYTCDYIDCMNPDELCNSGSRILRRVEDSVTHQKVMKEMIYIRSKGHPIVGPEAQKTIDEAKRSAEVADVFEMNDESSKGISARDIFEELERERKQK